MIPKVIYMCHKTLEHIRIYSNNWKVLNPEYEIKLYDNNLCQKFFLEECSLLHYKIFNFIPDGPIKADFWRICVINKYGGLYVDADIEPLVPLRNYINDDDDFVTCISDVLDLKIRNPRPDDIILNPHFILSDKNNDILQKAIDRYIYYYRNKVSYSYWKWSIVKLLQLGFKITQKKSQIMYVNNKKFKFLLELPGKNDCEYNGKIVLHNRYSSYVDHQFVDETKLLSKKIVKPNLVEKKISKLNEVSLIPNKTSHISNKIINLRSEIKTQKTISTIPNITSNENEDYDEESPSNYKVQMNQNIIFQPKMRPTFNVETIYPDEEILTQGTKTKGRFGQEKPNYFNSKIQNIIPKPDPTQSKTLNVPSNLILPLPTKVILKTKNTRKNFAIIYL